MIYFIRFCLKCFPFYISYEGRIVFSLFMILFTFSRFAFCSCDSVSWLFGSVSFGSVVFSFAEVCGSFSLGCFCLTPLGVSGTVLLFCFSVFFYGFLVILGQKTNPSSLSS